jgi:hypothetical protein
MVRSTTASHRHWVKVRRVRMRHVCARKILVYVDRRQKIMPKRETLSTKEKRESDGTVPISSVVSINPRTTQTD